MIRKLTLAIVTCPTSSILIQNHSAFHEYFANKRQIKASLSLEIVKKTSRDRMQRRKKVCRQKKVCDRMLPRSNFPVAHIQYRENVSWQSRLETRSSILEVFENRTSSIEARVSRIEFRGSRFEFRDTRRIFRVPRLGISRKRLISRTQNNNKEQ